MKPKLVPRGALLTATTLPVVALADHDEYEEYGDDSSEWIAPAPAVSLGVGVGPGGPEASVTFDTFYDSLRPHGELVEVRNYGRVWRPWHVAAGWRPYYQGNWEWTDDGWFWASEEPWGWATYHYGRWSFDDYYGWVWVPGYQWAPAWVTWRFSGDAIGWAPLYPGFSVEVVNYPVHYDHWVFVPCNRFVSTPVYSVAYQPAYVASVFHSTQPAPPRYGSHGVSGAPAWGGPARPFVESRVGHVIQPTRLVHVGTPAEIGPRDRGGPVQVYRPERHEPQRRAMAPPAGPSRGPQPTPAPRPGTPAPTVPPVGDDRHQHQNGNGHQEHGNGNGTGHQSHGAWNQPAPQGNPSSVRGPSGGGMQRTVPPPAQMRPSGNPGGGGGQRQGPRVSPAPAPGRRK